MSKSTSTLPQFTKALEKSSIGVLSPRLFPETSPSASASKGFLIVGTRVTSASTQFENSGRQVVGFVVGAVESISLEFD
jgi:hypothetical protein